ncbi:right-handed parallel beta-helix repeat-containing protein [Nocardiopsis sp. CNT-189]|uniref:right-handed parallel beta-helix repeat-containing protein n=1 Tax=Nocardiopsis oceanisediminis TaxID=2816862 RepID=UPI003B2FE2EB
MDSHQLAAGVLDDIVAHCSIVRGAGSNDMHILGGLDVEISDNRLVDITGYGVQVSSSADHVTAHGNRIRGTGSAGLNITTSITNVKIYSNDARGSTIVVPAGITGRDVTADNVPAPT